MQLHLDGFRPGDPRVAEAAAPEVVARHTGDLPDEMDVLIVGCGPAGLVLAAQLAQSPQITTRIVEQKSGPMQLGQADASGRWRCSRPSGSLTADRPVAVTLERVDPGGHGERSIVRARYVVGCDGARSTVRQLVGRELHGDSANRAWGVMDVLAVTDFRDIRLKSVVHSAAEGNLLVIPREGGHLVRLYVELEELAEGERVDRDAITADDLVAAARRILHPHDLTVHEVAWWSVYEIGQRLAERFDDVPDDQVGHRAPRVLIAGDACPTHSPKGRAVAQELIDFDREFARMFSARPTAAADADDDGVDPAEFQRYFVTQGRFTAGTETHDGPSLITAEATHQPAVAGRPVHTGRCRRRRGDRRAGHPPAGAPRLDLRAMPPLLPRKGRYGLVDHQKLFCPDRKAGPDIHDLRGVDRDGCLVVVRPDQHVAAGLPLDAHEEVAAFFCGFMLDPASTSTD